MANPAKLRFVGQLQRPGQRPENVVLIVDTSDVAKLRAANTFTNGQTISGSLPTLTLIETDAATDEGRWRYSMVAGSLAITTVDDEGSGAENVLVLRRSGTTATEVELNAASVTANGSEVLTAAEIAAATAIDVSGLAATDGIYVDDAGTAKRMAVQSMGLRPVAASTKTFALSDANSCNFTNDTAITLTIPPASSVAFGGGAVIALASRGTGTITVDPGSGVTLNSTIAQGSTTSRTVLAGGMALLWLGAAGDEWNLTGDIS